MGHNELRQGHVGDVQSAGFFSLGVDVSCGKLQLAVYGQSVSLKVASVPTRDRFLIARALGLDPQDLAN